MLAMRELDDPVRFEKHRQASQLHIPKHSPQACMPYALGTAERDKGWIGRPRTYLVDSTCGFVLMH